MQISHQVATTSRFQWTKALGHNKPRAQVYIEELYNLKVKHTVQLQENLILKRNEFCEGLYVCVCELGLRTKNDKTSNKNLEHKGAHPKPQQKLTTRKKKNLWGKSCNEKILN